MFTFFLPSFRSILFPSCCPLSIPCLPFPVILCPLSFFLYLSPFPSPPHFFPWKKFTAGYRHAASRAKAGRHVSILLIVFLGYRSDNFIVGLTDVSPAVTAPTLWNYDVCAQYPGVVGEGATVNLTCTSCMPLRRYLIIQIEINDALNFCEVEVYIRGKSVDRSINQSVILLAWKKT